MNIGEKVSLYKEKLKLANYQEFGKLVGINGNWIKELSKKTDAKFLDMEQLIKLCDYLGITIDQLVKNDEEQISVSPTYVETINREECDDIGKILSELIVLLDKDNIKLDGILLNSEAKQICKDSLDVVRILTKQYL